MIPEWIKVEKKTTTYFLKTADDRFTMNVEINEEEGRVYLKDQYGRDKFVFTHSAPETLRGIAELMKVAADLVVRSSVSSGGYKVYEEKGA